MPNDNEPDVTPVDPEDLTEEQKIANLEGQAFQAMAGGVHPCAFYPFADMYIELYPDDHPHIVSHHSERDLAGNITQLKNPWEGSGTLVGFGIFCMRFLLDEQGLLDHIAQLQELHKQVSAMNKANEKPGVVAPLVPMSKREGYRSEMKSIRVEDEYENQDEAKRLTDKYPTPTALRQRLFAELPREDD